MIRTFFIGMFLGILLLSCSKDESYVQMEYSNLSPFTEIETYSPFNLILVEDSIFSIRVSAKENTIEFIDFEINNKVLLLSNSKRNKYLSPDDNMVTITIRSKPLTKILALESCYIETQTPITTDGSFYVYFYSKASHADMEINSKVFHFTNGFPCGGRVNFWGETEELYLHNTALMTVDARELICDYAFVNTSSKGDCFITVNTALDYSLKDVGNIYVYGSDLNINLIEHSGEGEIFLID